MIFVLVLPRGCAGCPQGQFGLGARQGLSNHPPSLETEVGMALALGASGQAYAIPARD